MVQVLLISGYSLAFTSVWPWLIALVFVVAIAATYFYYRRTNPMLTRGLRVFLGTMRGLALAALFFVFAEPLLVVRHTDVKEPTIAIVVDNTSSMAQNRNSLEQFKAINDFVKDIVAKVPPSTKVVQYALSDTLVESAPITGTMPVTAIGDALSDLAEMYDGGNLQGVVLLSDGVSNVGRNPATEARKLGVPVTTVGFGSPNPLPDIGVVEINCNPVGFAGKDFPVEIVVESRGFENLRLPVRIRSEGRVMAEKEVDLVGNGKRQSVQLSFAPQSEGTLTLEASTPVQSNEESDKNNSRQVQVKIRKSQIRILLGMAYLNWEYKFLNQILTAKKDFKVDAYIDSKVRIGGTVPFPENIDALNEYDAILLYDFDGEWLNRHKQLFDAFFDRTGKGLFFMAGENFGTKPKSGFAQELLPYQFAEGRQAIVSQQAPFALTERGKIHPLMHLSDDINQTQRLLNALPPFTGYLQATNPSKEAVVIATTSSLLPGEPETPILGAQRYRNGKVATLSAFPLWKLDFLAKSVNDADSSVSRILENMVMWLVARDDVERIAITPDKPIFIAGETVRLNARVLDESYVPVADAEVGARLVSPQNPKDSSVVSFQMIRPGAYVATLHYLPSGNYQVSGTVKRDKLQIGTPAATFTVEPYSLEDLSHISDFDMLKRISDVSGGHFYAATDTAAIPRFTDSAPRTTVWRSEISLFDHPFLLGIIIVSLCVEWYMRKRYQLL
jgi:hypothetical protein